MNGRRRGIGFLAALLAAGLATTTGALAGQPSRITSFAATSSGSIAFTVPDLTNPLLAGSQAYGFSMNIRTSATPGVVQLTAPTITGTGGNTIPLGAFSAVCTATSDPGAMFTSSGTVQLGATPVNCATLAANITNSVNFTVTLYLDCTDGANAFAADTYASGSLAVTLNLP